MSYLVLARKWRPRRFADLVGQTHVARALINGLDNDRLHHAFLFTGTRGVGKTTIARILAKSLNCELGVSSQPCGTCSACREVDEGRFVDLIEVDAASRTKVDDTRELLDNVQYAPTRGRYKVYLIDEVHMLSGHSFNALLKTLEEPPPHVKFLLATTDPQKLPVTVLSRCLQFHLKRLSPELIQGQLEMILGAENIPFDLPSLHLIARSADGSMRDALSLLDQAIAFGGGKLSEAEVRDMLGTIDDSIIEQLLAALAGQDAAGLLNVAGESYERNADPVSVLGELLLALHRIAVIQAMPDSAGAAGEMNPVIQDAAKRLSPEDVQLFYQIGLIGRRDIALSPDTRTALEMTLLRMLAFRPAGLHGESPASGGRDRAAMAANPAPATSSRPTAKPAPVSTAAVTPISRPVEKPAPAVVVETPVTGMPVVEALAPWSEMVMTLPLSGLVRELATHATLDTREGGVFVFTLDQAFAHLLSRERVAALEQALTNALGRPLQVRMTAGSPKSETPARERERVQSARQQAATEAILADPTVQALQDEFGARVNPASIRPKG